MSRSIYKLTYFDFRGLGETARFIFAYAKIPFEDIRISREQWPALKPKTPFRQLPILEYDGQVFGQSNAINRLLAKKFSLYGNTEEEKAHIDAVVDYGKDIWMANIKYWTEQNPEKKAQIREEYAKTALLEHLQVLESHLNGCGGGNFFAPSGVSVADFWIANLLESVRERLPGALDKHPQLTQFIDRVYDLPGIKEWIATHPR